MNMEKVEREIDGITYIIKLFKDEEHPEKNRFDFEGEKYKVIIRTPKPVTGPPEEPKPTIHENVEEILVALGEIKEKLGVP